MSDSEIVILGIGNVLQKDDGIGIMLLKYVASRYRFPEKVELVDGGTAGMMLDRSLARRKRVIVLDALAVEGTPGEVRTLSGDHFINRPGTLKMSPHQVNFLDLIQLMGMEGTGPGRIDLVGVIPRDTDSGIEMSDPVRKALPDAEAALLALLRREEIVPERVEPPDKPDYWWL